MNDGETPVSWSSGPWTGKWTEPNRPYRPSPNYMYLHLSFSDGFLEGSGKDRVGIFSIRGSYDPEKLTCSFLKDYALHAVNYEGQRDGKGIYGRWSLPNYPGIMGGFHIWPSGLEEKAQATREESESLTDAIGKEITTQQPVLLEV